MKKYEELHTTIHSLDSHEIRYFKLFAQRHVIGESNTYLKLFDAIRKQSLSNDNELRKIFKDAAFSKNLPSIKLYLLRLINKSLYHFHDKEDPLSVILRHIKLTELFFAKGQYELANSNLKKAKRIAVQDEQFTFSLLISELQIKLSTFSAKQHKVVDVINDEMGYEKEIFKKYLNLREYQHAQAMYKALEKTVFMPETTSEKKQYDSILTQPVFDSVSNALSNKAKNIFYELKNSYQDKLKDKLKKQEISNELLDFFIEYPQLFRKNASAFIQATDEYLQDCLLAKKYTDFDSGLKKFKALQAPSKILQVQIIARASSLELKSAFSNDSFLDIKEIVLESEKQLMRHENSVRTPLLIQLYHETCSQFIAKNKIREALKWNLKIINYSGGYVKKDKLLKAKFINLIIHYLLKNNDYLISKINSEKRKYKTIKGKRSLELILLEILQNKITANSKKEYKQKETLLKKELESSYTTTAFSWLLSDTLVHEFYIGQKK